MTEREEEREKERERMTEREEEREGEKDRERRGDSLVFFQAWEYIQCSLQA